MSIFMSWGTPDDSVVSALKKHLESFGVGVWHSKDSMSSGEIRQQVNEAIDSSTAAVICLSAETLERDWVTYETNLLVKRFGQTPERIIPVWVGERPQNPKLPLGLSNINFIDLYSTPGPAKAQLTAAIESLFPSARGIRIPAALFAMTAAQASEIRSTLGADKHVAQLEQICRQFGMSDSPDLWESWSRRYGATVDEFRPFPDQPPLRQLVESLLDAVNGERVSKAGNGRPRKRLVAEWLHDSPSAVRDGASRDRLSQGRPLIIVDSLSLLHREVREQIRELPDLPSLLALICIPPYTVHTATAEDMLRGALRQESRLDDWIRRWERGEMAAVLDPAGPLSIRGLLSRVFKNHEEPDAPRPENLDTMQSQANPAMNTLRGIFDFAQSGPS